MAIVPRYKYMKNPETGKRETVYDTYKTGPRKGMPKLDEEGKPRPVVQSWRVQVYRTDPATGKQQRKDIGTFPVGKKREAEAAEEKAKTEIRAGTFDWGDRPDVRTPTVNDAVESWLAIKAMQVTSNTLNGYRTAASAYVSPAWGSLLVDEITYQHVQDQVNAWSDEGRGAQTINRAVLVLRGALDVQLRSGNILANAALGVVKPSVNQQEEVTIWTDAQAQRFLEVASKTDLAPLWHLLLLEGMRRSEALALRWSDIQWGQDGERATATIQRTLVPDLENGGAPMVQSRTKTKGGRRSVLLTKETTTALTEHRDRQAFWKKRMADQGAEWSAGDTIVTTGIGTYLWPSSVKNYLRTLIRECNKVHPFSQKHDEKSMYLPTDRHVPLVTTHALRHMAATKMLQGGAPLQLVQARLGHADVRMTSDRYGHLEVRDQLAAAEAIEQSLRSADK